MLKGGSRAVPMTYTTSTGKPRLLPSAACVHARRARSTPAPPACAAPLASPQLPRMLQLHRRQVLLGGVQVRRAWHGHQQGLLHQRLGRVVSVGGPRRRRRRGSTAVQTDCRRAGTLAWRSMPGRASSSQVQLLRRGHPPILRLALTPGEGRPAGVLCSAAAGGAAGPEAAGASSSEPNQPADIAFRWTM